MIAWYSRLRAEKLGTVLTMRTRETWFTGLVFRHFAIGILWESRKSINPESTNKSDNKR